MSILYVVATPIGNLEDITLRALRILKEADLILCEDTRITRRLLEKYAIVSKQLIAYNERKSGIKTEKIIEWLQEGKNVALVTDAGTPGISDPGVTLVEELRNEAPEVKIVAIPGPSALTAALSIAGMPIHEFTFFGFLPHKKGREKIFKEIVDSKRTVVFYESPHRILKTLHSLKIHLAVRPPSGGGSGGGKIGENRLTKNIVVARELTKIYEEVIRGTVEEIYDYFESQKEKVRGEFVVVVS